MISRHFRRQQVELSDLECNQIATLAVEVGGAHILEIFSPARFTTAAPKWGLRPGFAVDLSETKPFGPNMGAHWELNLDDDIEELEQMLEYEKPTLLTASFGQRQAASRRDGGPIGGRPTLPAHIGASLSETARRRPLVST